MGIVEEAKAALERIARQEFTPQSLRIERASKMFDSLVERGLIEPPTYRLALHGELRCPNRRNGPPLKKPASAYAGPKF